MKVFRYWKKVEGTLNIPGMPPQRATVYGASDLSWEDAEADAGKKLERIRERILGGRSLVSENYTAPIREEVLSSPGPGNIITRNRYGAQVLNSETLFFADVDDSCFRRRRPGWLGKLLGRREESVAEFRERILARTLEKLSDPLPPNAHIRVYRTRAGYRVLISGAELAPGSPAAAKLLKKLRSDRLYTMLCARQQCYRARLSPKPSRIGVKTPRLNYPYAPESLPELEKWLREYEEKSARCAVCRLVKTLGEPPLKSARSMIQAHDAACRTDSDLPLA